MMIFSMILTFLAVIAAGELWRMGGDGKKWARMLLVPGILAVVKLIISIPYGPICLISLAYAPALWALLSLFSYGITSPVHKFIVFLYGGKGSDGNFKPVELATRALCGLLWALGAIIFVFVTGKVQSFLIYALFLTVANGIIGSEVEDVEISERLAGICVALAILV